MTKRYKIDFDFVNLPDSVSLLAVLVDKTGDCVRGKILDIDTILLIQYLLKSYGR